MNSQTEKMLSTGLTLVRDAGSAAVEKLADSKVGTSLAKAVPKAGQLVGKMKKAATVGAGLAIAKRGGKAALAAAKKNPVAVAVGAVALAGLGVAVAVARKRKLEREAAGNGAAKPKRVSAKNMRANGAAAPAKKAAAKRAPRARKPTGASTH